MINNIVCPECSNSWDQEGKFDTTCKQCGHNCSDQAAPEEAEEGPICDSCGSAYEGMCENCGLPIDDSTPWDDEWPVEAESMDIKPGYVICGSCGNAYEANYVCQQCDSRNDHYFDRTS